MTKYVNKHRNVGNMSGIRYFAWRSFASVARRYLQNLILYPILHRGMQFVKRVGLPWCFHSFSNIKLERWYKKEFGMSGIRTRREDILYRTGEVYNTKAFYIGFGRSGLPEIAESDKPRRVFGISWRNQFLDRKSIPGIDFRSKTGKTESRFQES